MISIYCNSNKLVNRMGANVLQSAALMSRRNNISKLINHHCNNNNMQSMRSFSYKFDPPTSSNNKVTLLGVGLGFTAGILIGGFGIHVDVLPASTVIGFGPPKERDHYTQLIATSMTLSDDRLWFMVSCCCAEFPSS